MFRCVGAPGKERYKKQTFKIGGDMDLLDVPNQQPWKLAKRGENKNIFAWI